MNTTSQINQQTPGTVSFRPTGMISTDAPHRNVRFLAVVQAHGSPGLPYTLEDEANGRTLAAGFNLLDKTGRTLGCDAAELGERLDLVALIRALQLCERALTPSRNDRDLIAADEARAALSILPALP